MLKTPYVYFKDDGSVIDPFYTGVLLLPEGFSDPATKYAYDIEDALWAKLNHGTSCEAEIHSIIQGMSNVIDRWTALDSYFEKLLAENFMEPDQYAKLLFDDDSFSRSQKYFWAIGTLNEFGASIADNIKQLTLYYEARIKPLLESPYLAAGLEAMILRLTEDDRKMSAEKRGARRVAEFKALVADFETKQVSLVNVQGQFASRLETVKTLREGVSNSLVKHHLRWHLILSQAF